MKRDPDVAVTPLIPLASHQQAPVACDCDIAPKRWPQVERRLLFWLAAAVVVAAAWLYLTSPPQPASVAGDDDLASFAQLLSWHDEVAGSRLTEDSGPGRDLTAVERFAALKELRRHGVNWFRKPSLGSGETGFSLDDVIPAPPALVAPPLVLGEVVSTP